MMRSSLSGQVLLMGLPAKELNTTSGVAANVNAHLLTSVRITFQQYSIRWRLAPAIDRLFPHVVVHSGGVYFRL